MQRLILLLFFLSPYVVLSQTGPGGVSSGTTNILLWLDSKRVNDDGSNPATNAEVVTWYDQSGNNRDVTRNVEWCCNVYTPQELDSIISGTCSEVKLDFPTAIVREQL